MAKVYTFFVGVLAGLVLCKYSEAVGNTTEGLTASETECNHHRNGDNCTEQWNGHFSACPENFTFYCIHGECRYIKEMDMVSCRCHPGFVGSRCEFIELDMRTAERRRIIVICAVGGLVLLILLVVFICIFSHRRGRLCNKKRRRTDEPRNGTEKLHMDVTSALLADSPEQPHTTNSV